MADLLFTCNSGGVDVEDVTSASSSAINTSLVNVYYNQMSDPASLLAAFERIQLAILQHLNTQRS